MATFIHVYSHNFVVTTFERRFKWVIAAFIRNRLTVDKFQIGKNKDADSTLYAASNKNRSQVFLPIDMFEEFKILLTSQGIREDEYEITYHKPKKGARAEMKFIAPFKMSELQERCLTFIREPFIRRIAPLQTGKGKTATSLYYMCEYGQRTMIAMNAKYIARWVLDLVGEKAKVDLAPEDLLVVQGLVQLKKIILGVKTGNLSFKVMLVSNTTLSNFYKDFFDAPDEWKKLGIKVPHDLFTVLKIGLRIRDEAHEHFHFNFKFDLFTHLPKTLDLSATLIYDDQGVERMSKILYPVKDRFDQGKWDTYIDVYSVHYNLRQNTKIKWTQGYNGPYNHNNFEQSILANKVYKENFIIMVSCLVKELYIDPVLNAGKDEVCIIYASTREMCTVLSAWLQERYRDLEVNRYIGEDEYDNLLTADIIVATPKKAGTAVDIPKLGVIINTVNISSTASNIQLAGRLRYDKNIESKYYYMTCLGIPQHVKYEREKQHKLKGVVKSLNVYDTIYRI